MTVAVLFSLVGRVFVFVPVVRLLGVRMLVFRFARGMRMGMLVLVRVRMLVLMPVWMLMLRAAVQVLMFVLVIVRVIVFVFVRVIVILLLAHGVPLSAPAALQMTDRVQTSRNGVAQSPVRPPRRRVFRVS